MRANRRIIVAAVTGFLMASTARAGNLTPTGAPGPTMHTLTEIYQQLLTTQQKIANLEARLEASGISAAPAGMVWIPAGDFVMGDTFSEGNSNELPLHTVSVSAFYMDAIEVTKAKWDEVYTWATANGYTFDNEGWSIETNIPVSMVNWYDCVKWANARSEKEGLTACYTTDGEVCRTSAANPVCDWSANGYRLPTEAEWEKAARGGAANRRFPWSDTSTIQHARANYWADSSYSYDTSPTEGYYYDDEWGFYNGARPADSFSPNGYGLYHMAGNVLEWCWDWHMQTYYASSPDTDPHGPDSGTSRASRGGSWTEQAPACRIAYRYYLSPTVADDSVGFRLVRAAQ